MKANRESYLNCLLSLHNDWVETGVISYIPNKAHSFGISTNIGTGLVKMGTIVMTGKGKYKWVGREPDEPMVTELLQYVSMKKTKPVNTAKYLKSATITSVIDKVFDLIEVAQKYGIPADKQRDFVKDFYYKK